MRDAGILDGDLLAVHRTSEFRSGQIVVARLHDEVTVKRIRKNRDKVELIAENPAFATRVIDLKRDTLEIEGIAVGIIRNGRAL
jgi:repressor LexA